MTFAIFYAKFPRHISRRDAEKAWNQAMKRGVTPEAIMHVLDLRMKTDWRGRSREFLPYPATFLREEDFDMEFEAQEDDIEPMPLFKAAETDAYLTEQAKLIHISLTREQERWRKEAAVHKCSDSPFLPASYRCAGGDRCKYRKEPRVPTMDELLQHLKGAAK